MSTRRSFLRQGFIMAGGLMLPVSSFANFFQTRKTKVIVIGAGFSGLAAACRLKEKNFDVTVLESTNRIGGRVFSHQLGKSHVVELGAEWVGDSHNRIKELCGEFKLTLDLNQMDSHVIYKGKHMAPAPSPFPYSEEWDTKFKQLLADYKWFSNEDKLKLDQMDWWHYLVNNGCKGKDLDMRELLDSTDFGESIRHVSAFAALAEYAESSEKNEMDFKIQGGNAMLATKLSERLGRHNILTGYAVTSVEQGDQGVKVYCANGKMFEADKIICTLPTFALKKIDWQPGLPQEKTDAINELQYARINKHVMLFDKRFWKAENFDMITDQLPHYFYHATQGQAGPAGALISYTIGDKAAVVANQSDEWNFRTIKETLKPVFGDVSRHLKQQANYYWGNDERSHGSYAVYGPGQWFRLRPILKAPFMHTHFAGEHLAEWQGFMEGAINTGEDAAMEI
jgi:monoamine oxidase